MIVSCSFVCATQSQPKRFASKKGAYARARENKDIRNLVCGEVYFAVWDTMQHEGIFWSDVYYAYRQGRFSMMPHKVIITRQSAGELDYGNLWDAMKPVVDGIADALHMSDDRELQKPPRMLLEQVKGKPGQQWLHITLHFND